MFAEGTASLEVQIVLGVLGTLVLGLNTWAWSKMLQARRVYSEATSQREPVLPAHDPHDAMRQELDGDKVTDREVTKKRYWSSVKLCFLLFALFGVVWIASFGMGAPRVGIGLWVGWGLHGILVKALNRTVLKQMNAQAWRGMWRGLISTYSMKPPKARKDASTSDHAEECAPDPRRPDEQGRSEPTE